MDQTDYHRKQKERAQDIFNKVGDVFCPYFQKNIIFNSDGFHHLRFSARRERNKHEQILKFTLLPLAIKIIKKTGTVQEYRKMPVATGKKSKRGGFQTMKQVEYWGFIAIVGENNLKIKTVLKKIGDGNIIFWSVMPFSKLKRGREQKLATGKIEDD
ncbi:MAG: hypothetical protein GXP44_01255 [bacterium]|nr:hypothetical protein [bacterium]